MHPRQVVVRAVLLVLLFEHESLVLSVTERVQHAPGSSEMFVLYRCIYTVECVGTFQCIR